jgi:hypothetical protein
MSILNTLVQAFDPEGTLGIAVTNPQSLQSATKTANLIAGRRVPFQASINGMMIPAFATLKSANLSRLSLEDHTSANGTKPLVTGIFNNVQMDIELLIGTEMMTIQEFLLASSNAAALQDKTVTALNEHKVQVARDLTPEEIAQITSETQDAFVASTLEQFTPTLESLGFRFNSGMTFFWQQFGANIEGYNKILEAFKSVGAINVLGSTKNVPANVREIWAMPQNLTGPAVVGFEVGRATRSESKTGQGFLDFADAIAENYKRVVGLRREADIINSDILKNSVAQGWSAEKIEAAEKYAASLIRVSQQWANTWSGSSRGVTVDPKDPSVQIPQNQYYVTKAPCGRFSVVVDGKTMPVDLWTNSLSANTSGNVTSSAPASAVAGESPINWE